MARLNALLDAVEAADAVTRPAADLKVGDPVIVRGQQAKPNTRKVESIGRTWITVSGTHLKFRRDTLRSARGIGTEWWLETPEQYDYDSRLRAARERLRLAGLPVNGIQAPPDGTVFAIAALLDLLDAEQADKGEL